MRITHFHENQRLDRRHALVARSSLYQLSVGTFDELLGPLSDGDKIIITGPVSTPVIA